MTDPLRWSVSAGRASGTFTDDWMHGSGAFGGQIAALLGGAMAKVVRPGRVPRSLTVHFCAPGRREGHVGAEVLREGLLISHARATLTSRRGRIVAAALATFAEPGADRRVVEPLAAPDAPPPDAVVETSTDAARSPFTQHFEYRQCLGAMPGAGADPYIGGWCRPRVGGPADLAMFAALLDAWAPAVASAMDRTPRAVTIDLTYHFLAALPLAEAAPDAWYLYAARCPSARGGVAEETGGLWTADGRMIARTRQLVAFSG